MSPDTYQDLLRDLLSRDPERVRAANRKLYGAMVQTGTAVTLASGAPERYNGDLGHTDREADLALARAAA